MTIRKNLIVTALAATTALTLSACTDTAPNVNTEGATTVEAPAGATDETTAGAPEATTGAGDDQADDHADDQADDTQGSDAAQTTGEDPVFAAIDAVLAEYSDGIVVDIDREDRSGVYDIDIVVGQEVIELEVSEDGSVREDDRENDDDDDVEEARRATVTAAEAITQALESHPDGVLDELELEEDDGQLRFEIDLDDHDRRDLAGINIPAN